MIRCAVVGASGYSGAELVSLLTDHPEAEIAALQAQSNAGAAWQDLYPRWRHRAGGTLEPTDPGALAGLDVVFLALPAGESAPLAGQLVGKVGHVIDLGGDLRLDDSDQYRAWYGREHPCPQLLGLARYGLPELFGPELPGAELVACAGCYATVVQLAAAPALARGCGTDLVVAASSGTTGAGRKAALELSFSEVTRDARPYRVGRHQHTPEIIAGLARRTGRQVRLTFVPQLIPLDRGIVAAVTLPIEQPCNTTQLTDYYREFYRSSPLVRVSDPSIRLPGTGDVAGTPFCDLAAVVDPTGERLVVVGAIDNLQKGAASQAIQVMNAVTQLPDQLGLLSLGRTETLLGV